MSGIIFYACRTVQAHNSLTHKKLNGCEVKLSPVFHGIVLRATPCSVCKSLSAKLI